MVLLSSSPSSTNDGDRGVIPKGESVIVFMRVRLSFYVYSFSLLVVSLVNLSSFIDASR